MEKSKKQRAKSIMAEKYIPCCIQTKEPEASRYEMGI